MQNSITSTHRPDRLVIFIVCVIIYTHMYTSMIFSFKFIMLVGAYCASTGY